MQCNICGKKKATVHLTEIVNDQMTELHLCEECSREKSVQMEQQFGLADLLAGLSDFGKQVKDYEEVKLQCNNCGLTYDEFKKFGRLGCSECYSSFKEHLGVLLKKIHGSSKHLGKSPKTFSAVSKMREESIKELRDQLLQAVQQEDFEKAAEIRDKIRAYENKEKEK